MNNIIDNIIHGIGEIALAWRDKYEHETIFPTRFWAAVVNESEDENA